MAKGKHKRTRWLLPILAILAGTSGLFASTLREIRQYGSTTSEKSADAAIVLGAGLRKNRPAPVFQERINHAVLLYRNGRVRKIIFTGGKGSATTVPEAVAAKQSAIELGVPEGDLVIEDQSKTTYENLVFANTLASKAGLHSYLIVSDPWHMRRAMDIAADLKLDAQPSPTQTSRYVTPQSTRRFAWREAFFLLKYRLADRILDQL
ncbi:MAG: hypothetical protein QOJ65_2609 [Fimbriimonadaceae bacterium]|jgi:uncharacterized SAM-binding protein YcdF (DUF218 family)|nr:hypothetical protein [Fimbriimonadaceae bacterium]